MTRVGAIMGSGSLPPILKRVYGNVRGNGSAGSLHSIQVPNLQKAALSTGAKRVGRSGNGNGNGNGKKEILQSIYGPLVAARAYDVSCFRKIDWKVDAAAPVMEAIERMARHNIGALAVTQGRYFDTCSEVGKVVGIITERDIISKIHLLGKDPKSESVKGICTYGISNLVMVHSSDSVDKSMHKMLVSDIRHLLLRDDDGGDAVHDGERDREREEGQGIEVTGLISIKDVVKCVLAKHSEKVESLHGVLRDLGIDQLAHCEMAYSTCSVSGNGLGMASYTHSSVEVEVGIEDTTETEAGVDVEDEEKKQQ